MNPQDLTAAEDVFKGDVKDKENDPVIQMEACSKPIIGAINGFAVTAGFEIALTCDILVASSDAKFIDTHCKYGPHFCIMSSVTIVVDTHFSITSFVIIFVDTHFSTFWIAVFFVHVFLPTMMVILGLKSTLKYRDI